MVGERRTSETRHDVRLGSCVAFHFESRSGPHVVGRVRDEIFCTIDECLLHRNHCANDLEGERMELPVDDVLVSAMLRGLVMLYGHESLIMSGTMC